MLLHILEFMKSILIRISWLLCLTALLAGCGDDTFDTPSVTGSTSVSTPTLTPFASTSYTLGELDGTLSSALVGALEDRNTFTAGTLEGPVILADDVLGQLEPDLETALVEAYRDGRSIIMLQPDQSEVNALRSLLGLGESYVLPTGLPDGKQYAELVGFDREETGGVYTLEVYPPTEASIDETDFLWLDDAEAQAARVEMVLDWLREDRQRPRTVEGDGATLSPRDLQALAQAQVESKIFTYYGAIYQVTHYIYACHSFTDPLALDFDWFFIQQACQINYSGGYKKVEDIPISGGKQATAGLYGGTLKTDSWLLNQDNASQNVLLAVNSPETANNVATVTSGVSYSFGGTVGFRGMDPTGGVSSGVSVSSSKSFSVSDCQVVNNSASRFSNAQWEYIFRKVEGIRYIFYAGLADPPALSTGSFQPVNQWIWRVSPAVRQRAENQSFRTRLDTIKIGSGGGTVDGPWVGKGPFHADYPWVWEFDTPLRYPPLLVAPGSLSFNAAASFQTMDFSASQDWTITSDQPWCTTTPSSGVANLSRTNVTCEQNTSGTDRTARLTISSPANGGSTVVQVFQSRF